MFLFRTLSVPGRAAKKAPLVEVVLFSLLAQSCTAISGLSQRSDPLRSEGSPGGTGIQKVSVEPEGKKTSPARKIKHALYGTASWYGPGFHGKKTASGEIYNQNKLTAAHKTVPLGTKARVTNLENGNSVQVEINDRGPFVQGRIIDLSRAAAEALGFVESGTARVRVELMTEADGA
jgi:rare lipoprotein A